MGSCPSIHKRFLAFQIFHMMKIGRYCETPFSANQLDKFSSNVGALQSKFTLKKQKRPPMTSLRNRQLTKRCSTDSASSLQRQHLFGPFHPFLHKMSQVFIFFIAGEPYKTFNLNGDIKIPNLHHDIIFQHSFVICDNQIISFPGSHHAPPFIIHP